MKPAAGVMTTRPTTAPEQAPTVVGLLKSESRPSQVKLAAAVAMWVLAKAMPADGSDAAEMAEPALKPNLEKNTNGISCEQTQGKGSNTYQPNQRRAVPRTTKGTLAGVCASLVWLMRGPRTRAAARAEKPEVMCTTVPPAKSCRCRQTLKITRIKKEK